MLLKSKEMVLANNTFLEIKQAALQIRCNFMTWFNILKSPRGFLEGIAEKHGGQVSGKITKSGHVNYALHGNWGQVLLKSDRQGLMHVHIRDNEGIAEVHSNYNLGDIYIDVLTKVGELNG